MAPTPTIPDTVQGFEEALHDSARVNAMMADGSFGDFVNAYVKKISEKDTSLEQQIEAQVKAEWKSFCLENGIDPNQLAEPVNRPNMAPFARAKNEPVTSAVRKQELYNERAYGAALDVAGLFADAREYFQVVGARPGGRYQNDPEIQAKRAKLVELTNAYGSQVPSDGGFLVPETVRSEILELALETAVVRPRATVIPMDSLRVSLPMVDEVSRVSSVKGGIVAGWAEEGAAMDVDSSAKFGRVVLEAKKLFSYAAPPNELLDDAPAFRAWFQRSFPSAIAWFEDLAFLSGNGVGQPLGVLHTGATASVSVPKESGQAAVTIVLENILKMYARMLPTSLGSAVWTANIDTFPELMTMALTVGTGGGPVMLTNAAEGPPLTILGRPVNFTEKVPTAGTVGDISFIDFSYYLIGDRQTMQVNSSEHYRFANGQTAFLVTERVDGRPWLNSAITPNKGTNTLSPIVKLATRA
jgi:HK97 family phage major capsid protein